MSLVELPILFGRGRELDFQAAHIVLAGILRVSEATAEVFDFGAESISLGKAFCLRLCVLSCNPE